MQCVKWKVIVLAAAIAVFVGMAWPGQAVGVVTNVAYKSTVSSSIAGATYAQPVPLTYDNWRPVLSDDIFYQAPYNYCYVNRNTGHSFYWDMGQPYDLTAVDVIARATNKWLYNLEGAKVIGLDSSLNEVGSFIIPSGLHGSAISYTETVDWKGVQTIRLYDITPDVPDVDDDLMLSELRAFADVPGYTNFIGDVNVTTTSELIAGNPHYQIENLTNNRGMSDQGGAGAVVGDPAAKSICATGNWLSSNLLVETSEGSGIYEYTDAPVLTFDMGGMATLNDIRIWNYNWSSSNTPTNGVTQPTVGDYTYRGTKDMLVEYSTDGGNSYTALADANGSADGNYTIAQGQPSQARSEIGIPSDYWWYDYAMNDAELAIGLSDLAADHIRITALSSYADEPSGIVSYRGLSEVRFYGTVVVVENPIPGDTNDDGAVDDLDAKKLAANWGASVTAGDVTRGDFNSDGVVDAADAAILAAHWGYTPGEATVVPEPSTLLLLLTLALGGFLRRRAG